MSVYVIKVLLNTKKNVLEVNKNPLIVDANVNRRPSRILWVLDDSKELENANFVLPDDNDGPGFRWDDQDLDKFFDIHEIWGDEKIISILDRHFDQNSHGPRRYTLRVKSKDNGEIYETESDKPASTDFEEKFRGKSPVIINR